MKWLLSVLALVLIVGAAFYLKLSPEACRMVTVYIPEGRTIRAELATTSLEVTRGLSNRTSLAPNHGMLFLFNELGLHPFWMKDTKIPLDILWMHNGQIVDLTT